MEIRYDYFIATPSFEPKNGKQLAYNQGKSIMIVNTTTWVVENELTDEKVILVPLICSLFFCSSVLHGFIVLLFNFLVEKVKIQYLRIFKMRKIYCGWWREW